MKWPFSSWLAALVVALCVAPAVQAQAMATPRDLPSTEQAKAWIDQDLSVVEARRMATAADHRAAAVAAGSHEWTARLTTQQRSVRGDGNSSEWSAQLERGIRTPTCVPVEANLMAGLNKSLPCTLTLSKRKLVSSSPINAVRELFPNVLRR